MVSACKSQPCGEIFVAAGVPHVVAIDKWRPMLDDAGHVFAQVSWLGAILGPV